MFSAREPTEPFGKPEISERRNFQPLLQLRAREQTLVIHEQETFPFQIQISDHRRREMLIDPELPVTSNLFLAARIIDRCISDPHSLQHELLDVASKRRLDEHVPVAHHHWRKLTVFHDLEPTIRELIQPRMPLIAENVVRKLHSESLNPSIARSGKGNPVGSHEERNRS